METTQFTTTFDMQSTLTPDHRGTFTIALPTGADAVKIACVNHRLRSGVAFEDLDPDSQAVLVMLSTLSVVVREAPDWWYCTEGDVPQAKKVPAPEQLRDLPMLWDLFAKYADFRKSFRKNQETR